MQSATFSVSSSSSSLLQRRNRALSPNRNSGVAFRCSSSLAISAVNKSSSSVSLGRLCGGVSRLGWTVPILDRIEKRERFGIVGVSSSVPGNAEGGEGESLEKPEVAKGSMMQTLQLGSLFGLWYLFNIYFNIYNKQVLKVFPYPITVTTVQFAVGTLLVLFMWTTNLYKKPKISSQQLITILPLAIVHTLGNLFTNMSLGKVAVSFTHTIKASEPFFSVFLSAIFLGEMPSLLVLGSLLPIVGGVALASMTETSFNWAGFWSAMASNLTNQFRNVLSKKFMVKKEKRFDFLDGLINKSVSIKTGD